MVHFVLLCITIQVSVCSSSIVQCLTEKFIILLITLQDVESNCSGRPQLFHPPLSSTGANGASAAAASEAKIKRNNVNGHNGLCYETRDTVASASHAGNGAVSVQPLLNSSSSSRKNSRSNNPFLEPSKRHSSVDMKGNFADIFKCGSNENEMRLLIYS